MEKILNRGKFIVLEGIDGCGKSTQANLICNELKTKGYDVLHTKEPTKGKIGLLVREYLREESNALIDTFLFTADRIEHTANEIKPAIEKGKIVICERYFYSTIAYQKAQGVDEDLIKIINSFAISPNLVILLDVNVKKAIKRVKTNEKFEKLEFLKKVRENYLKLAEELNFKIVNSEKNIDEVKKEILEFIYKILEK